MNIVTAWQRATRPRDAFPGPINFAERPAASPPSAAMFDLSGDPDALDATGQCATNLPRRSPCTLLHGRYANRGCFMVLRIFRAALVRVNLVSVD